MRAGVEKGRIDQDQNIRHYRSGLAFFFFFFFLTGVVFFAAGAVRFLTGSIVSDEVDCADKRVSTEELANDGNNAG